MKKPKEPKGPKRPLATIEGIEKAEHTREALVLRKEGLDYDEIAQKLGLSKATVVTSIRDAIRAIPEEEARDLRALECARFDEMHRRTVKAIKVYEREVAQFEKSGGYAGSGPGRCPSNQIFLELQEHLLSISAARRKMLGLDAPTEVKGSGVALLGLADLLTVRDAMDQNEDPCPPLLPKN
jgi:hypothetical protein